MPLSPYANFISPNFSFPHHNVPFYQTFLDSFVFFRLSLHVPLLAASPILSSLLLPKRVHSVCPSENKAPSNYSSIFLNSLFVSFQWSCLHRHNFTIPFLWLIFPSKTTITKFCAPTKLRFISTLIWQVVLLSSLQKLSACAFHSTVFCCVFSWDVTWGFSCSCSTGALQELY